LICGAIGSSWSPPRNSFRTEVPAALLGTIVCLSARLWESAMRGMVVLLVLSVAQVAPPRTFAATSTPRVVSQQGISGRPRVVLSINSKATQRQVHLVGGSSSYPTVDVTCDGKRW